MPNHPDTGDDTAPRPGVPQAFALALGAAVSLGLARFSYALLLPSMRNDLGWTYFTAGAMNTANAAGYLVGALLMPRWLARADARWVMLAGMLAAALLLAAHGLAHGEVVLLLLRGATGVASAGTFVAGGLLAARLGQALAADPAHRHRGALVLGLYYGGTGAGIVASTLLVPASAQWAAATVAGGGAGLGWRAAWVTLAMAALAATALAARGTRVLAAPPPPVGGGARAPWSALGWALAGYLCFGLGYIGYMTFVITLLRERGLPALHVHAFYLLLGMGVMVSPWLWSGLLQRHRGGVPLALLNGLLALATVLPVAVAGLWAVYASGALFGAVFLSLVASTTALVRHNLAPAAWASGIAAFTIIFAAGQIIGPSLVGAIADGAGGLQRGFAISAGLLALGAVLAVMQRALPAPKT